MGSRVGCIVVVAALLACRDPDPRCDTVTGQIPGKLVLDACSDKRRREVTCEPMSGGAWEGLSLCYCKRDGALGRTFNWPTTGNVIEAKQRRVLEEELMRLCHWSLNLE